MAGTARGAAAIKLREVVSGSLAKPEVPHPEVAQHPPVHGWWPRSITMSGRTALSFFGTLLGWLGVALTGSDTASNILFGNLQKITSEQL